MIVEERTLHTSYVFSESDIAVLIPCYNEQVTIAKVVRDFQTIIPGCTVYVYDNNLTDNTRRGHVRRCHRAQRNKLQGKGHVRWRMFAGHRS